MRKLSIGFIAATLALTLNAAMFQGPEVAPGLFIPHGGIPWALDIFAGAPELVPIHHSTVSVDNHRGSNLARSAVFGKQKMTTQLDGLHANTRLHTTAPAFFVPVGEPFFPLLVVFGFCVSLQKLHLIKSGISLGLEYDRITLDNMYLHLWNIGISDGMRCSSLRMWQRESWGCDLVHHRVVLLGPPGSHVLKISNGRTRSTQRSWFSHPINTRNGS